MSPGHDHHYGAERNLDHRLIQIATAGVLEFMPKLMTKAKYAVAALVLGGALAGCGSNTASSASTTSAGKTSTSGAGASTSAVASAAPSDVLDVAISNYSYHAATIAVAVGTRVTFTNHDQTAHTATGTKSAFDTGTVNPGKSATVTFRKPGTYTYYCQFHAFMHGTVIVR